MSGRDLVFTRAAAADVPRLQALSRTRALGTELYSALQLGAETDLPALWTGKDETGAVRCAVCDCAAYKVWLAGRRAAVGRHDGGAASIFAPPKRFSRFVVLKKKGPAAQPARAVRRLTGTQIRALYELVADGRPMTEALERFYVHTVRCANRGLADAFGVYEDGALVSGAQILAKNEKYALVGNVCTDRAFRRRGFAADALAACERAAAAQGLIPVLYCEKKMAAYYLKRGYRKVKRHEM